VTEVVQQGEGEAAGAQPQAEPEKKAPSGRRVGRIYRRGHVWWIQFHHRGRLYRESSKSTVKARATDLLKKRLGEMGLGNLIGTVVERTTFEDLAEMLVSDYVMNGRRSLPGAKKSIEHLRVTFGLHRALDITRDRVDAHTAARLKANAAPATVQKELAALGRMFTLAVRSGKLQVRPQFTRLKIENTRTVSFTDEELDAVIDVLVHGRPATAKDSEAEPHPDLVPPIVFAAVTGWRMKSDVFTLEWRQVDFKSGTVWRPGRGTSKAARTISFPFSALPELAGLLQRQREATTALERERGCIIPLVFHRNGRPIRDMYDAWRTACERAGVPGRIPHDLRRTGARALRALGMGDRDIAEMCGWETLEMVTRYLGRDPAGIADRLRLKVAEFEARADKVRAPSVVESPDITAGMSNS
jgi:integrase